ncbi:MAG: hypothetical protein R2766_13300 [Saprospiraceae bacterium]
MIEKINQEIELHASNSIFSPNVDGLTSEDWDELLEFIRLDYARYYSSEFDVTKIKYFPGLLATFYYRIARHLYLSDREVLALEFSSLGASLTNIELYYSAEIGQSFKINHGLSTVVGSRTQVGNNVTLHHTVTLGEKNGGRAKLGDNVVVYPGAIIVGDTFIGHNSIVGANVFVDQSYPANSIIK